MRETVGVSNNTGAEEEEEEEYLGMML